MSSKLEKRMEKAQRQVEYFKNKINEALSKDPDIKNKPEFRLLKKKLRRAQRKLRKYKILFEKTQPKKVEAESE